VALVFITRLACESRILASISVCPFWWVTLTSDNSALFEHLKKETPLHSICRYVVRQNHDAREPAANHRDFPQRLWPEYSVFTRQQRTMGPQISKYQRTEP
jgi:hypothetical protein